MDGVTVRITLSLIPPGILLVFAIAFVGAWLLDRRLRYLLLLAAGCAGFALGAASQILYWPQDTGLNAIVSGGLYTLGLLLAVEGILLRSGRPFGWAIDAAVFAAFVGLLWYFYYVERSLLARVYIQNCGYGLVFLAASVRLASLARGKPVDRILFWVMLVFGAHFFPRTLLTIGFSAPAGARAFANSLFWQALQLSLAVLGAALALAVLVAAFNDIMEHLKQERDVDALTGVLNRRGFEEITRSGEPGSSLVLCDLDHFKQVNDVHGHHVGDEVLRDVGAVLRANARKGDAVGRLGGEEFAIHLTRAGIRDAYECAERLRAAIAAHAYTLPDGAGGITASFGVAEIEEGESWESLYRRADARLYRAKQTSRNRTVASDDLAAEAAGA